MRLFTLFALCVTVAYAEFSPEFKENMMQNMTKIILHCTQKEQPTKADIEDAMAKKLPTSRTGKCLLACFHEQFSGLDKETGKYTREGMITSLAPFKDEDPALYEKLLQLVDICLKEVTSDDRCDAAAEMEACYMKHASEELKVFDS